MTQRNPISSPTEAGLPDTLLRGVVRPATEADLSPIATIHSRSWRTAYRGIVPDAALAAKTPESCLEGWVGVFEAHPANLFVFDDGDGVRGFTCAGPIVDVERNGPYGFEIFGLHAHPDMTGRGIGHALVRAALSSAAIHGLSTIVWTFEALTRSRRFYEQIGGAMVGQREWRGDGYSLPEVAYAWPLTPTITK